MARARAPQTTHNPCVGIPRYPRQWSWSRHLVKLCEEDLVAVVTVVVKVELAQVR
jgi:hypothetical protein